MIMKLDFIALLFLTQAFSVKWQSNKVNGAANEFTLNKIQEKKLEEQSGPFLLFEDIFLNSGTLEFQFKTYVKNALVLYQDDEGYSSYIQITLNEGRLNIACNLDKKYTAESKHTYNDFEWHYMKLERTRNMILLLLQDERIEFDLRRARRASKFETPLQIGGFPMARFQEPNSITSQDAWLYFLGFGHGHNTNGGKPRFFNACIKNIKYTPLGNRSILLQPTHSGFATAGKCTLTECDQPEPVCKNNGRCFIDKNKSVACDCRWTGYNGGKRCTERSLELYLNGTYRIIFDWKRSVVTAENENIKFRMKTRQPRALIMETEDTTDLKDKLKFELIEGKLVTVLNIGQENDVFLKTKERLNDGKWHVVEYARDRKRFWVTVDGKDRITNEIKPNTKTSYDNKRLDFFKLHFGERESPYRYHGKIVALQDFVWNSARLNEVNLVTGLYAWYNTTRNTDYRCTVLPKNTLPWFNRKLAVIPTKYTKATVTPGTQTTPDCFQLPEGKPCHETEYTPSQPVKDPKSGARTGEDDNSSLAWIVVVTVICALLLFAAIAFFIYRWNKRYSGDFQITKKEIGPTGTIVRYNDTAAYYDDKRRSSIAKI